MKARTRAVLALVFATLVAAGQAVPHAKNGPRFAESEARLRALLAEHKEKHPEMIVPAVEPMGQVDMKQARKDDVVGVIIGIRARDTKTFLTLSQGLDFGG